MAVLAFRGTEKDSRDIKTDLNLRFYSANGAKVHTGFQQAFRRVAPAINEALTSLGAFKLYITGHSLGGALALVAARLLSADNVVLWGRFGHGIWHVLTAAAIAVMFLALTP